MYVHVYLRGRAGRLRKIAILSGAIRAGPSWKLRSQSRSFMLVIGTKLFEPSLLLPRSATEGS